LQAGFGHSLQIRGVACGKRYIPQLWFGSLRRCSGKCKHTALLARRFREAGAYERRTDFVYHSALGLREMKKKKESTCWEGRWWGSPSQSALLTPRPPSCGDMFQRTLQQVLSKEPVRNHCSQSCSSPRTLESRTTRIAPRALLPPGPPSCGEL